MPPVVSYVFNKASGEGLPDTTSVILRQLGLLPLLLKTQSARPLGNKCLLMPAGCNALCACQLLFDHSKVSGNGEALQH